MSEQKPGQHMALTFLGAGNMAGSLISGLLRDGLDPSCIRVADPIDAQRDRFSQQGLATYADNNAAIDGADVIVLAIKPQIARAVVAGLDNLQAGQLLLSIAAGITLTSLQNWSDSKQAIVRCMPNTPALLSAGMTGLYANEHCTAQQKEAAQNILTAAGETLWVHEERALDAVTAVSGSGPAYFFLLMEAMVEAGENLGLDHETATRLTLQTAYGAALMARASEDSPGVLRQNVTSPGGTTEAAMRVMMEQGFPDIILRALQAADHRSAELAEEFGGGSA